MNAGVDRWLAFAREDLQMAELAFTEDIYNQVCFHSQQGIEKTLKAGITFLGGSPPRSHAIADLIRLLPAHWLEHLADDLADIDDYYIPTRYPDALPGTLPEGLPGRNQAHEAYKLAQEVLAIVVSRVADERSQEGRGKP